MLALMLGPFAEERAIGEGLAPGYEARPLWRCPTTAADDLTRDLAERESTLIHHAVAAAAEEAGAPAVRFNTPARLVAGTRSLRDERRGVRTRPGCTNAR